jgi:DNA-binding transcriptional LysR family regulator
MVVLNKELQSGFNTFLTAPRGGVLNPSARIKTISGSSFPCIDFHALGNMPMVLMKKGHQMRVIQNRIFSENQYIPNTILETDNAYTCLRMAESGIAATILPKMKDKQSVKKIEIFSFEKEYCRQTYLCYRKNTYFPKILGEFINVTRNVLQSGSI